MTDTKDIPPLRLKPVLFLDTETTGLLQNPHAEVIEIAVVDVGGRVLLNTKVKPANLEKALAFDEEGTRVALKINGYTEEAWKDAPTFLELVPKIEETFLHKVIIGQNPNFDREAVLRGLTLAGVEDPQKILSRHIIDTTTLAYEHLVPCGLDRLNLSAICEFLGISLNREERHGALNDAQACREAYLTMVRANGAQRDLWSARGLKMSNNISASK